MTVSTFNASKQLGEVTVGDSTTGMDRFVPYFGEATHMPNIVMDPYRKRSTEHFALPEAYQGRNYYMGQLVELRVMNEDTWYYEILPIRRIMDGTVPVRGITWNTWIFDNTFADVLPEETPASLLTYRREENARAFVRRGKAFSLEHGFMETPEGRRSYAKNLEQIVNLVSETGKFDIVYELINVDVGEQQWNARFGFTFTESVRDAIEQEKERWAILQKTKNGFEKFDTQVKQYMRKNHGVADTWVLHENMMTHLNLARPEKTDYYMAGEGGPARVNNYDSTQTIAYLNGNIRVYLSRSFAVGKYNQEIDPWMRERQIGEYFLMASEYQHNGDVSEYNSEEMSPAVYDEYTDDYAILSIRAAIRHSPLFDSIGRIRPPIKNFDVPNWEKDIKKDPFVKDGLRGIDLWGEISPKYLPTEAVMRMARSALRKLSGRYEGGMKQVSSTLRQGLDLLRAIEKKPITQKYITALRTANPGKLVDFVLDDSRFGQSHAQRTFPSNSYGSLKLPIVTDAPESALVGFANYPGLRTISAYVSETSANRAAIQGYNYSELETLARLTGLIEDMVVSVKQIFPDSMFIDKRFTAPHYSIASSEAVLLDNLLGTSGEALWMSKNATEPRKDTSERINADDREILTAMRAVIPGLTENDATNILSSFELPKTVDTSADRPFYKQESRRVAGELFTLLNFNDTETKDELVNMFKANSNNIEGVLDWASKNYKKFATDSRNAWKATIERLLSGLADAKNEDARLQGTYGENLLSANSIQASYAPSAPEAADNIYYRTPLTLSANQIVQIARDPGAISATVSRRGTYGGIAASAAEIRLMARKIKMEKDMGAFYDTDMAHIIKSRSGRSAPVQADALALREEEQKRFRERLTGRASKRRKLVLGDDAQEEMDYYSIHTGSMGSLRQQIIIEGTDGIENAAGEVGDVSPNLAEHYRGVERSSDDVSVKLVAKIFLGQSATRQSLEAMVDNNTVLPIIFMAARPHMRYNMRMGIKAQAGSATGNTFIGQSWFELSDDTQKQVHHADYRYWSKAVVTNPKNVYLAFDLFSQEGLGGAGVKPISLDHYDPAQNKFGRDREESLFFIPLPYSSGIQGDDNTQQLAETIDLSGRFVHFKTLNGQAQEELTALHYPTAARMNGFIGWRTEYAMGTVPLYDTSHPWRFDHEDIAMHYNTTVCRGHQKNWDRNDKKRTISKKNTGHWGHLTVPGCAKIRNGGLKDFSDIVAY